MADLIFVLCAGLCLISAMAIVTRKNPVYSVICMLPFFIGMAGLFVLLSAPFLAAMEIMVYGGAILVVFLFVIMLINIRNEDLRDDFSMRSYLTAALIAGLLGGVILSFSRAATEGESIDANGQSVAGVSKLEAAFAAAPGTYVDASASAASDNENDGETAVAAVDDQAPEFGSIESLGMPLFQKHVVPFELIGLLLTVGLLGAVLLSKKKTEEAEDETEDTPHAH